MIEQGQVEQFFEAVVSDNQLEITRSFNHLSPLLIRYLRGMMNAQLADAEDVIQNVFSKTIDAIRSGRIEDPSKIGAYLIKAVRNNYISYTRKNQLEDLSEDPGYFASLSEQIDTLVEEEKFEALRDCVSDLDETNKNFMKFWLAKPDERADVLASYFKMSVSYVFTKKHRLIKVLSECVKKKLDD